MSNKATTAAAVQRLEGIAADFLETHIAILEKTEGIKVKDVEVAVIPGAEGDSPAVDVVVST